MVENLDISGIDPVMSDEDFTAACREATVRLLGAVLTITRLDADEAKTLIRPALEAIGARPYDRAPGKYHFGQPPPDEAA